MAINGDIIAPPCATYKTALASPDVIVPSLPRIHFEAKRTERLSLYDAVAQAKRDAGDKLPIVAHRRNACEWLAILPLTDLMLIVRESSYVQDDQIDDV